MLLQRFCGWNYITLCNYVFCSLPLEGMKRKVMRNLRTLEQEGMVNSQNDYQEIINAIAKVCDLISTPFL